MKNFTLFLGICGQKAHNLIKKNHIFDIKKCENRSKMTPRITEGVKSGLETWYFSCCRVLHSLILFLKAVNTVCTLRLLRASLRSLLSKSSQFWLIFSTAGSDRFTSWKPVTFGPSFWNSVMFRSRKPWHTHTHTHAHTHKSFHWRNSSSTHCIHVSPGKWTNSPDWPGCNGSSSSFSSVQQSEQEGKLG